MSAIFLDLSKAFDAINHGLLHVYGLRTYGFSKQVFRFTCSNLKNNKLNKQK